MDQPRGYGLEEGAGPRDWTVVFEVLGIRWTEPFLPKLGIVTNQVASLRETARTFVSSYVNLALQSALDSWLEELLNRTLHEIATVHGTHVEEAILRLGFMAKDDRDSEFYWSFLFAHLVEPYQGLTQISLPLDEHGTLLLKRVASNYQSESIASMDLEGTLAEFSDDLEYLTESALSFGDSEPTDPTTWVTEWADTLAMRRAWQTLRTELSRKELDLILAWAREQGPLLNLDGEPVVPPPSSS